MRAGPAGLGHGRVGRDRDDDDRDAAVVSPFAVALRGVKSRSLKQTTPMPAQVTFIPAENRRLLAALRG